MALAHKERAKRKISIITKGCACFKREKIRHKGQKGEGEGKGCERTA